MERKQMHVVMLTFQWLEDFLILKIWYSKYIGNKNTYNISLESTD